MKIKKSVKLFSVTLLLVLAVVNVFIFVSGLELGKKIEYLEGETSRIERENNDYQEQYFEANSLQHAASKAADLNFINRAEPYYLTVPGFARSGR